jgi:hypothetical protein
VQQYGWPLNLLNTNKEVYMTGLDLINKFQKDIWNNSNTMFGDTFDSIFDSWSKAHPFHFTM